MALRGTLDLRPQKAKVQMPRTRMLSKKLLHLGLVSLEKDALTLTGPVCKEVELRIGEATPAYLGDPTVRAKVRKRGRW